MSVSTVLIPVWWTWDVLCWGDRLTAGFADVLRQYRTAKILSYRDFRLQFEARPSVLHSRGGRWIDLVDLWHYEALELNLPLLKHKTTRSNYAVTTLVLIGTSLASGIRNFPWKNIYCYQAHYGKTSGSKSILHQSNIVSLFLLAHVPAKKKEHANSGFPPFETPCCAFACPA